MQKKIKEDQFERIIYIGGIWNLPYKNRKWKEVLENKFPDKEILFFTDVFYWTWEVKKIESIMKDIIKILTTNKKNTIIFSHSLGGIIGRTIISRILDSDKKYIKLFVSMASPYKMFFYPFLNTTRKKIKTPATKPDVNFLTLGGYLDPMTPFFISHIDKQHALNFWVDHTSFYRSKNLIKTIINLCIED